MASTSNATSMEKIYYDLNVPIEEDLNETVKKVERLISFGYHVIALSILHTVSNKRKRGGKKAANDDDDDNNVWRKFQGQFERLLTSLKDKPSNFKILKRVTVILDNPDHVRCLQSEFIQSFDLIAVRPTNEKLFLQSCTQIEQMDMISLHLDEKVPFRMKYSTLGAAVDRGVFIELSYASAIRSQSLRQNVLSNALQLVKKSKGKGIVFTSNAQHHMEVRGPHDIVNLGALFGLKGNQQSEAIGKSCKSLVLHAYARTKTAKSVICMRKVGAPKTDIDSIVQGEIEGNQDKVLHDEPTAKRKKET